MSDLVVEALSNLLGRPVGRRELTREPDRRLRWIEVGTGPTVVLVAGSGEMSLDWANILTELARQHRTVAYDRAGSGASDPLPRLSIDAETADLAALLIETGPAVVVGHSWGGLVVQLAAMRRPELFRGVVLVDSSHETVLGNVPWHLRLAERGMGTAVVAMQRLGWFGRLAAMEGRKLAERCTDDPARQHLLADAYVDSYSRTHQIAMIRDEARLASRGVDWIRRQRAEAPPPDIPLIALSATDKPRTVRQLSITATADLCASLPQGRQIVVDDSGHYIHHDRPDAVLSAIAELAGPAEDGR